MVPSQPSCQIWWTGRSTCVIAGILSLFGFSCGHTRNPGSYPTSLHNHRRSSSRPFSVSLDITTWSTQRLSSSRSISIRPKRMGQISSRSLQPSQQDCSIYYPMNKIRHVYWQFLPHTVVTGYTCSQSPPADFAWKTMLYA